jgi:uncharacterized FlgJ-related protein
VRYLGRIGKYIVLLFASCILALNGYSQNSNRHYIQQHQELALNLSDSFGIPVALILAVAIVESGAGNSRNARILHNHFGMKAGNKYRVVRGIKTKYRCYDSDSASYLDFCTYLSKRKFYPKLKGNSNVNAWLNAMTKSGYSASPTEWKRRIRLHIKKYKLQELQPVNVGAKPQQ